MLSHPGGPVISPSPPARGDSCLSPSAVFSFSVWNGLLSACPTSILEAQMEPGFLHPATLRTRTTCSLFSRCLWHEGAATYNQSQGLSCLVLQSDSFLELMLNSIVLQLLLFPLLALQSTHHHKSVDVLGLFCFWLF